MLDEKSSRHRADLKKLGHAVEDEPLSDKVLLVPETPQLVGMGTTIHDRDTDREQFIFYFDRLATLLIEK